MPFFVSAAVLLATNASSQNLLDNPGFEQGTNFWEPSGSATLAITNSAHSGVSAGLVSNGGTNLQGVSQWMTGKLQNSVGYFCSCWVRPGSAASQTFQLLVDQQTGSTTQAVAVAGKTLATSNWVYFSGTFSPSGTGTVGNTSINITSTGGFLVDDVVVLPLSGLRLAARDTALRLGGIMSDTSLQNDSTFARVTGNEYHIAGAENALKFANTEPALNTYNFGPSDTIVNAAMAAGQNSRGHTLVWHGSVPSWISSGSFTSTQLQSIVYSHVDTVVGRYQQKLFCWDVVNEAFNDNGTMRSSVWYDQPGIGYAGQGTKYIEELFKRARSDAPDTDLIYNDYNTETLNAKSDAVYAMALGFQQRGVPLNGIGFQMHVALPGPDLNLWRTNLQRFDQLGLKLHITEMDVRLPVNAAGVASAADLQSQADVYFNVIGTALAFPHLAVVQTWGFSDRYSWIPSFFSGYGAALPLDQNFNRKPAWWAIHDVLANQAELLPVIDISSGASEILLTNLLFSAGRARQLLANGTNDFITLALDVPYGGPYEVRVGVQKTGSGGQFQLAEAPIGQNGFTSIGPVQDTYAPVPVNAEFRSGTNTFDSAGTRALRFSVVGRNASSSGYRLTLDYVRLTPTGTDGNQPPSVSQIADQAIDASQPRLCVPFSVSDRQTVESALNLKVSSSNAALLPGSRINLLGAGQQRVLSLSPVSGQSGASLITIVATDASSSSATNQFTLTVNPIPLLAAGAQAGQLQLNWPASSTQWFLESTPALDDSLSWQKLTDTPVLTNHNWFLSIPLNGPSSFFRLAR